MHMLFKQAASIAVLVIGLYLLFNNWGPVTPPLLSGVAFALLGVMHTHKAFFCCSMKKK